MKKALFWSLFTCCITSSAVLPASELRYPEKIVNGLWTQAEPTTVALFETVPGFQEAFCSGVLIGCQTVLTAAHCVCQDLGAPCEGENLLDTDGFAVYLQHFGSVAVESVTVSPDFVPLEGSDMAVLRLTEPVTGITPTPINDLQELSPGSGATLVGFGTDDSVGGGVTGIKRTVATVTQPCAGADEGEKLCYNFTAPVGPPGQSGSACFVDSGGPMFATVDGGRVLAAVAEAVSQCRPPNALNNSHTSVFANREWISEVAGDDLGGASCGPLPAVGGPDTTVIPLRGNSYQGDSPDLHTFEVSPGAQTLRLSLNSGFLGSASLSHGSQPTYSNAECTLFDDFESCEIDLPAAGTWYLQVGPFSADYQATVTLFYPPGSGAGQGGLPVASNPSEFCLPSLNTLCIDAGLRDRRFKVEVAFDTQIGAGASGKAFFLPVAAQLRGGLMWFFSPDNPEMLVKVLNGCDINDHFWVFAAATTTVGYELTVTDMVTGAVYRNVNPDGQQAQPVSDVTAFPCM